MGQLDALCNVQSSAHPNQTGRLNHDARHQTTCKNTDQSHLKRHPDRIHRIKRCLNHLDTPWPTSQTQTLVNHANAALRPDKPANTHAPLSLAAKYHTLVLKAHYLCRQNWAPSLRVMSLQPRNAMTLKSVVACRTQRL